MDALPLALKHAQSSLLAETKEQFETEFQPSQVDVHKTVSENVHLMYDHCYRVLENPFQLLIFLHALAKHYARGFIYILSNFTRTL